MLKNFHLLAIVRESDGHSLLRFPIHQKLQAELAGRWAEQLEVFLDFEKSVPFDPGFNPESDERFEINDFQLPEFLADVTSENTQDFRTITEEEYTTLKGVTAFAKSSKDEELILFQNFSRSHVISPYRIWFYEGDLFQTTEHRAISLERKLAAVYFSTDQKLMFQNFRTANTFLPLHEYYEEASEKEIKEVLSHEKLAAENIEALAADAPQWYRKRFAMLRDSGVLDDYSVETIVEHSKGYEVEIKVADNGKLVFPAERKEARRLLQFLNEELYRGPITETLYETNSKREAD